MPPKSASSGEYRQEAERIRREAACASSEALRQQLLAIAQGYDALATTAEMIARNRTGRSADRGLDKP